MIYAFEQLFDQARPAFTQQRTFARARTLAMSALVGLGRKTVSGMLCASGQQFVYWSAAYRVFEWQRFDRGALFAPARRAVLGQLPPQDSLVVLMDDTLLRKRGRKIHGAGWRRDPLGPKFCNNFIWGQRFLQMSAALPDVSGSGQARGVPIDLVHAPSPAKPGKKATADARAEYRLKQQAMKVSTVGAMRLAELRAQLDIDSSGRRIVASVDGGFTNRTVFRTLPPNTTLIGRIRKDARLFLPPTPAQTGRRGRPRWFGEQLPTPEQIRQDDAIPWTQVEAFCAGKRHLFQVKAVSPVRWTSTGARDVRLVAIRPLAPIVLAKGPGSCIVTLFTLFAQTLNCLSINCFRLIFGDGRSS